MVELRGGECHINPIILNETTEGIKLEKNSKGNTWEIKIIKQNDQSWEQLIDNLKDIDNRMHAKFDNNIGFQLDERGLK